MNQPTLKFERKLWRNGFKYVCGIDEVGRGPWAGPVVAAAVIFDRNASLKNLTKLGIRDSKQLSPAKRELLDPIIRQNCLAYSICETSVKIINREGIVDACQRTYRKCLKKLKTPADFILMDAFYIKKVAKEMQKPIIKGDQKSISVAAASIIAKVYRDNLMLKLHKKLPQYHFDKHKGYGTKKHQEALVQHGTCSQHRTKFIPEKLKALTS